MTNEGIVVALPGYVAGLRLFILAWVEIGAHYSAHYPTSTCLQRCVSPSLHQGLEAQYLTVIHMSHVPPTNRYAENNHLTKYPNPSPLT